MDVFVCARAISERQVKSYDYFTRVRLIKWPLPREPRKEKRVAKTVTRQRGNYYGHKSLILV